MARLYTAAVKRTRKLPIGARYGCTLALTGAWMIIRYMIDHFIAPVTPFSLGPLLILLCASLFDSGSGILATILIVLFGIWIGDMDLATGDVISITNFLIAGVLTSLVVETLHHSIVSLTESEQSRALMLKEFRHRTRNDLQSLVSLLMLRARTAPTRESRDALEEAAGHAMALARVHTWLANATPGDSYEALVDTEKFINGLCAELKRAVAAQGLRPVAIIPCAEQHWLPTERAVQLGLVINETVTNALKYAFPGDYGGEIDVRFFRDNGNFRLLVEDDGVGVPEENVMDPATAHSLVREPRMGTRLLRGLAAQLRGSFTRRRRCAGGGTVTELVFPVDAPSMLGRKK